MMTTFEKDASTYISKDHHKLKKITEASARVVYIKWYIIIIIIIIIFFFYAR